jgi:hypothetical protein
VGRTWEDRHPGQRQAGLTWPTADRDNNNDNDIGDIGGVHHPSYCSGLHDGLIRRAQHQAEAGSSIGNSEDTTTTIDNDSYDNDQRLRPQPRLIYAHHDNTPSSKQKLGVVAAIPLAVYSFVPLYSRTSCPFVAINLTLLLPHCRRCARVDSIIAGDKDDSTKWKR